MNQSERTMAFTVPGIRLVNQPNESEEATLQEIKLCRAGEDERRGTGGLIPFSEWGLAVDLGNDVPPESANVAADA